jgi:phospholipid/cholesterol/gamma-HCH transport system permease protein
LTCARPTADALQVNLSGNWKVAGELPSVATVLQEVESTPRAGRVLLDAAGVTEWDSRLLTLLGKIMDRSTALEIDLDRSGLPGGVRRLLDLARAVPEKDTGKGGTPQPWLARVGNTATEWLAASLEIITFVGEAVLSFLRLATGRARFRRVDLMLTIQECGAQALPIVMLISFLVGLILALVGAVQLQLFGADIFVANLVGLAMAREMGAMMTGIIMAGRTGAAFAAQLGTMTVNEEIDAFKTLGFSPMDFLVLPRMLALMLMMPLLCVFADIVGILGGAVVGIGMLDLSAPLYYQQTVGSLSVTDFAVGVAKSVVFGVLVALSGCLRGMQCGRSSAAVGAAATSAVVTAIVWIIVSDAMFTVILNVLGI